MDIEARVMRQFAITQELAKIIVQCARTNLVMDFRDHRDIPPNFEKNQYFGYIVEFLGGQPQKLYTPCGEWFVGEVPGRSAHGLAFLRNKRLEMVRFPTESADFGLRYAITALDGERLEDPEERSEYLDSEEAYRIWDRLTRTYIVERLAWRDYFVVSVKKKPVGATPQELWGELVVVSEMKDNGLLKVTNGEGMVAEVPVTDLMFYKSGILD